MDTVFKYLEALANLFTAVLGGFGTYQLIFRRKQIASQIKGFLALLKSVRTTSAVTQIRATIEQLRSLTYEHRESRKKIKALMGQLAGQLDSILERSSRLAQLQTEVHARLKDWRGFSEVHKLKLLSEIESQLDLVTHSNNEELLPQ